jgi:hypothetical protein
MMILLGEKKKDFGENVPTYPTFAGKAEEMKTHRTLRRQSQRNTNWRKSDSIGG